MNESFLDFNFVFIISLFTFFANLVIGLFVILRNSRSATYVVFSLFSLFVALWALTNYVSLFQMDFNATLFWVRIVLSNAALMFTALYFLSIIFPEKKISGLNWFNFLMIGLGVVSAAASLTPLVFESITPVMVGSFVRVENSISGPLIFLYAFAVLGLPLLSFFALYRKYQKAAGSLKAQLPWLMTGIGLTFFLTSITNFILVNAFKNATLVVLGPFFTLIFVGLCAYAILKHRLLDIKPIIFRSVSFIILIIIIAVLYALMIFAASAVAGNVKMDAPTIISAFVLAVITMLTFQPLQRLIRRSTNRIFFKEQYDRDELLTRLTHIMAEEIELKTMTGKILETLIAEMRLTKAGFLIVDNHKITDTMGIGYEDHEFTDPELESLFHQYVSPSRYFAVEELSEGNLKEVFRKLDIALALPLRVENAEVAILLLGPKLSGEMYYPRDIEVIDVFASGAGIAIENAKAYDKIKKFSAELEQRVLERTAELKKSQAQELAKAKEIARLKDEFLFLAVHELRTPVAAIRGFLDLTHEAKTKFTKKVQHNLEVMAKASEYLNRLVNDILEIARSESGTAPIEVHPLDFNPLLEEVLLETAPLMKERKIELERNIAPGLLVLSDSSKLKEILMNLLDNAIKYNRVNGRIEIRAYAAPDKKAFIFEIKDTGYGIPKEQQGKVFQKFFRATSQGAPGVLGTGLGLFITRMLLQKMNGTITFHSMEGKGTTFTFSLPAAQ